MTRKEAAAMIRDVPNVWKALAALAAAALIGWGGHAALSAQQSVLPRLDAVESRVDTLEYFRREDRRLLEEIHCVVSALAESAPAQRCLLR